MNCIKCGKEVEVLTSTRECFDCRCESFQQSIKWVQCPRCKKAWNALIHTGICIDCRDSDLAEERRKRHEKEKKQDGESKLFNRIVSHPEKSLPNETEF